MVDYKTLGDTFAERLRERLTLRQWQMMRHDNRCETHPNICHSHDYLDANMVMDVALAEHGVNIWTDDGEEMREEVQHLWNDAWTYAKAAHLTEEA